jgi:hypothetical protein
MVNPYSRSTVSPGADTQYSKSKDTREPAAEARNEPLRAASAATDEKKETVAPW